MRFPQHDNRDGQAQIPDRRATQAQVSRARSPRLRGDDRQHQSDPNSPVGANTFTDRQPR